MVTREPITNETLTQSESHIEALKDEGFIQQTLFGASIMDFTVSLGLNSSSSTLSVRLVEDDVNYGTQIRTNHLRDAVTEGYHPWNREAFPADLLKDTNLSPNEYPNYGVVPMEAFNRSTTTYPRNVELDLGGSGSVLGDMFFPPEVGAPAFFKYYMPEDLTLDCMNKENESSVVNYDANTHGLCKIDEDGGTGLDNLKTKAVTDSAGNPPTDANGCEELGGLTNEAGECVEPLNRRECEEEEGVWVEFEINSFCPASFEFNGIFKKYEKTIGSSGVVYNVEIIDPRILLENTTVILSDISNRTAPADKWVFPDSSRALEYGFMGHRNVLNVFGYYEDVGMGNSKINEAGMIWYDPYENSAEELGELKSPYGENGWGVLGALDTMLNSHNWYDDAKAQGSGHDNDGIVSDYILNGEPFGGPIYYGTDYRLNSEAAPLGERQLVPELMDWGEGNLAKIHRYKVDLFDLTELSENVNPGKCVDENDKPVTVTDKTSEDPKHNCERSGGIYKAGGTLPFDFRVSANKITLLSLIEQVCSAAGADFFVSLERPSRHQGEGFYGKEENYAGVIKVTPVFRNRSLVKPIQRDISRKLKEKNWLSLGIDLALDKKEPTGPFTKPVISNKKLSLQPEDTVNPRYNEEQRQSIISSASLGYEFGDPVTGVMIYGNKRSRIVGATPQGDRRKNRFFRYESAFKPDELFEEGGDPLAFPATDQAYEYLPATEVDGVTLRHQRKLPDQFYEMENEEYTVDGKNYGYTWNDHGNEYKEVGECSHNPQNSVYTKEECENHGSCSDTSIGNEGEEATSLDCTGEDVEYTPYTWTPTGYRLEPREYLKHDYLRNGAHYSNDNFLPFYHPFDFQKDPKNGVKEFDPNQLNRINSKEFEDIMAKTGYCKGDPSLTLETAPEDPLNGCIEFGTCTDLFDAIVLGGSVPKAACDDASGIWTAHTWVPSNASARSGFLDIYPCWGFEQKYIEDAKYSTTFDDIIEVKEELEPIKGMYWDDDPYKDFHPSDGIFSVFEFYNPGLGDCINDGCSEDKWKGSPTCFLTATGDKVEGDDITNEESCLSAGGKCSKATDSEGTAITTKEKCEEEKDGGTPVNTWTSENTYLKSNESIGASFDGSAEAKVCEDNNGKIGEVMDSTVFGNNRLLCECDPLAPFRNEEFSYTKEELLQIPVMDDCAAAHDAAGEETGITFTDGKYTADLSVTLPKKRFRSHCKINSVCKAGDGSVLNNMHESKIGTGNGLHKVQGSCENACFKKPNDGEASTGTDAILAFYVKTVEGKFTKGDEATIDDGHEDGAFEDLEATGNNGTVQLILDETTCVETLAKLTGKVYEWSPVNGSVKADLDHDEDLKIRKNTYTSTGGPYNKKCKAISFHSPVKGGCLYATPHVDAGKPSLYRTVKECEIAMEKGEPVEWTKADDFGGQIEDKYYGVTIPADKNPNPGYVVPRFKITKGKCTTQTEETNEDGEVTGTEETETGDIPDSTFRPKIVRDPNYSIAQDCYAASSEAEIGYDTPVALKNIWIPRTATIPIKIDGYAVEGTPNELGGMSNEFGEPNQFNENSYYRATVTELRHAAVSLESWTSYLRTFAPHLPCHMYAANPTYSSVWAEYCPLTHQEVTMGIGKAAVDALVTAHTLLARGQANLTLTQAQHHQVANKEKAEKQTGRGLQRGELTDYEQSRLELDRAYKAVREIATNYYGKRFLVPLPVIPPRFNHCSGYKAEIDRGGQEDGGTQFVKGAIRWDTKEDCERNGFEWNAHPDLTRMLDTNGVEDENNWNIVSSAWPGGTVDLKDEADSYPTNLNFWNDDGNLKAFAVFPSKVKNRLNENVQVTGFNNYDPERVQVTQSPILRDILDLAPVEATELSEGFGDRVYVEIDVDPKIYWLHDRSLIERTLGHQHFMYKTGDKEAFQNPVEGGGEGGDETKDDERGRVNFTTIGTRTNQLTLNSRSIYKSSDVNDLDIIETNGSCMSPEGLLIEGIKTKTECLFDEDGNKRENVWDPYPFSNDGGLSGPKRPYALITLPERVIYQENDIIDYKKNVISMSETADSGSESTEDTNVTFSQGFQVSLSETTNSEELIKGWLFEQLGRDETALRQISQLLVRQNADPFGGVDIDRPGMIAAAMKPWHAGIPQESNLFRWGPFANGYGFGKVEVDIDNSYHPAAFGGEDPLHIVAFKHAGARVERGENKAFESGSVTLASGPEHKLGSQPTLYFPDKLPEHLGGLPIEYDNVLGPYITDVAVDVGTNGITTRYGFNSQSRFGDLNKIYEERMRKEQRDIIRNAKKQEDDFKKLRRNIKEFRE